MNDWEIILWICNDADAACWLSQNCNWLITLNLYCFCCNTCYSYTLNIKFFNWKCTDIVFFFRLVNNSSGPVIYHSHTHQNNMIAYGKCSSLMFFDLFTLDPFPPRVCDYLLNVCVLFAVWWGFLYIFDVV